jgi:membrane protein YdbS with pleckstrin-like domain
MVVNKKPYQWLSWLATVVLVAAATLASFVPEWHWHHWAFIVGNALWIAVGYLWKENSLLYMNIGLTIIYVAGLML